MLRRIILVAEHASTRWGGEAILPYHYFRLLRARGADVHLLVHERCREELESHFPADLARLHFIADTPLQRWLHALSHYLPRRVAEATVGLANQMITQTAQKRALQSLIEPGTVVHQPIPVAPRFPSRIHGVGAPVVIGPMNGGMEYPPAFRPPEGTASRAAIGLARALSTAVQHLLPGKRRAACLLAANERTRSVLASFTFGDIHVIAENGVDLSQWQVAHPPRQTATGPARFLFVGRLVDWKALDIALEALRDVEDSALDIVGDGPMRESWVRVANELGLSTRVRFHGWLDQHQCAAMMRESLALLLPSLYECGGAVVLEAMACARPVIATAWGGPLDYLDATCGFLIQPTSRAELVAGFRDAMRALTTHPELADRMGAAGRTRVAQHFDWESKIDAMLAVYESALASSEATMPARVATAR